MIQPNEFNFIIDSGHVQSQDRKMVFDNEPINEMRNDTDMFDLLVTCNVFPSKSIARKCWKKTGRKIPDGFSDFTKIGKMWKRITIWNPIC